LKDSKHQFIADTSLAIPYLLLKYKNQVGKGDPMKLMNESVDFIKDVLKSN